MDSESTTVLHVDDDLGFGETVTFFLEQANSKITVDVARSVAEGCTLLDEGSYDCIVSDYDFPESDGIKFLKSVREDYPALPFILYTGEDLKEVASEAISAGVTDFMRKRRGKDQYTVLANRIENSVAQYRAKQEADQVRQRPQESTENSIDRRRISDGGKAKSQARPETGAEISAPLQDSHRKGTPAQKDGECLPERARERMHLALSSTDSVVFEINLDTGAIERHGAYKQLFGIPSEETLTWKDHIQQAVHPGDKERVCQFYQQLIDGIQDKDRLEYRTNPKQGTVSWIKSEIPVKEESDTGSRHAIGVAQNITTQKERELELQRKERRFHAIFDDPNILVGLVSPEGILLEINQTAMDYIQASSADVVGESFWKTPWFNHCETLQNEVRAWINRAASGEYVEFEARLKSPENDPYMVEGMFRPVKNDDGDVVSILVTDRDITDRKRYEHEVEQQNKRLTDFAGIVSHDLRNPLQVAQGRLEIVQDDITHEQLPVIDKAQQRIQQLIDELLLVANQRDITVNTKTVDLEKTSRDCWQNVSTAHATLITDVPEKIRADKTKLEQLLKNLFRNAIEHSGATSRVEVGALEDGFYIADDGPGIPQDDRENVFTLGYSRSNAGTGIGLTVIKEIVAAHDWTITITDSTSSGARFEITGVDFIEE